MVEIESDGGRSSHILKGMPGAEEGGWRRESRNGLLSGMIFIATSRREQKPAVNRLYAQRSCAVADLIFLTRYVYRVTHK